MAADEAPEVKFRLLVEDAARRCATARRLLADLLGDLTTLMLVADAPASRRAWADVAAAMLAVESRGLAFAASLMASASLTTLRLRAAAARLRPIDDENLRIALAQLQRARVCAENARNSVELCRAHLRAARLLLDHLHLHGVVDGLLNLSRVCFRHELAAAVRFAEESAALAPVALLRLS